MSQNEIDMLAKDYSGKIRDTGMLLKRQVIAEAFKAGYAAAQKSEQLTPVDGKDPFIEKMMQRVKDKTKDSLIHAHIERMWGGLEMASIEYFMKTGTVNGSFRTRLIELIEAANRYKMELTPTPLEAGKPNNLK